MRGRPHGRLQELTARGYHAGTDERGLTRKRARQIPAALTLLPPVAGFTQAPVTEAITGAVPKQKAGIASAVNGSTRPFGGTLGVAVIVSVAAFLYTSRLTALLPPGCPTGPSPPPKDPSAAPPPPAQPCGTDGPRPPSRRRRGRVRAQPHRRLPGRRRRRPACAILAPRPPAGRAGRRPASRRRRTASRPPDRRGDHPLAGRQVILDTTAQRG